MKKLKRYLVFVYDCYYPHGGMSDFVISLDELPSHEGLKNIAIKNKDIEDYSDGTISVYDSEIGERIITIYYEHGLFKIINTDDDSTIGLV